VRGPQPSRAARNRELSQLDDTAGRHGRLRVRAGVLLHFKAKEKVEFECLDCGVGSEGKWLMQTRNVLIGVGCPMCKLLVPLMSALRTLFPRYRFVPVIAKAGAPNIAKIRFETWPRTWRLPDDFEWSPPAVGHTALRKALAERRLPGEKALHQYEMLVQVVQAYRQAFPKGIIWYAGKSKPGNTSPGPFYAVDTGPRTLRATFRTKAISGAGLRKHCAQENKDRTLRQSLEKEAKKHGATILGYVPRETGGFEIRYLSRTGFESCDSRWRAREKFWGQSGFRRGETLALVVLAELFPVADWRRNTRPGFLLKDNGYRLELDGYSPSLGLALEYQGNHHYKPRTGEQRDRIRHIQVLAHDRLKAQLCKKAKISLVVVRERRLDATAFLSDVLSAVKKTRVVPMNSRPSVDAIRIRWESICSNPLAPFQKQVLKGLGSHQLVEPELPIVGKATVIRYRCGNCGAENDADASGFTTGAPRRYCPVCKGSAGGRLRRKATMDRWANAGLPRAFLDALQPGGNTSRIRYVYRCDQEHETLIHGIEHAMRHVRNGAFQCPACASEATGINVRHVAHFDQYRQSMINNLTALGLGPVTDCSYDDEGELTAEVQCRQGHRFALSRRKASLMMLNHCLNDRNISPSACPTCCYPGVERNDFLVLRSTVFHRLHVLRGMYSDAQYVDGFDVTSWGQEEYVCGNLHSDGMPHPVIRISFRNLQKQARRAPRTHLCAACGLEAGEVVRGGKTLDDLVALMKIMRDEIVRWAALPARNKQPTVDVVSGECAKDGRISTTRTRLRFWCGVTGHDPIVATKDYYFNRAAVRGPGFCPQCVALTGKRKAPLPPQRGEHRALRMYRLRDE